MFSRDGMDDGIIILVPPLPIKHNIYRCDSLFHIDTLKRLYRTSDSYGIILINGQNTVFYTYQQGRGHEQIMKYSVRLPRNHDQGGQSQNRIERLRQEKILEYLKSVNDRALKLYWDTDGCQANIQGLFIIGTGLKKEQFLNDVLDYRLKELHKETIVSDHVDDAAVEHHINGLDMHEQRSLWRVFEDLVTKNSDRLCFGLQETMDLLENAMLQTIYVDAGTEEFLVKCSDVGCKLVIVGDLCRDYGICGVKWF